MLHSSILNFNNFNIYNSFSISLESLNYLVDYLSISSTYNFMFIIGKYLYNWTNFNMLNNIFLDNLYIFSNDSNFYFNNTLNYGLLNNLLTFDVVYTNSYKLNINSPFYFFNTAKFVYLFIFTFFFLFLFNSNVLRINYCYLVLNTIFQKVSDVSEQEYGSFDDFQILLTYLFYIFSTYVWVVMAWYVLDLYSNSWVFSGLLIMTIFMISIPVKLLIDMGITFLMYVKGASNSSNLIVELVFDLIGIIIFFTRFILQNIRLVLVFLAYFELFEWVLMSLDFNIFLYSFFNNNFSLLSYNINTSILGIFISFIKVIFVYLYHLLHLIIVSFIQIGIYLMISFWLFFFFYTSSNKVIFDTYFYNKRAL